MAAGNVSQALGSMQEYVRPDLEILMMLGPSRLWKRITTRTDVKAVSNRPSRIPFQVQAGGKLRADPTGFNGGDMGTGSGPNETYGQLSCTSFLYCASYTAAADYNTDSDEKAIESYVKLTHTQALDVVAQAMDAIFAGVGSNGSNTLDTVVSTTTDGLVVTNANEFYSNQDVDCWSALGGVLLGTVTVLTVDFANKTIWLTGPVPAGVVAGTLLLVSGSAGQANSGLAGLRAYQSAGNTGSYMGIQKSSFPGDFSTPNISVGGTLTPAVARAVEAQIEGAIGIEKADQSKIIAHCNTDMRAAWENTGLNVQHLIYNEMKGDSSADMLKRKPPLTIAGREMLVNEHAAQGLIDFLALEHWFRIESKKLDLYDVGGQTLFPEYGISGGLASVDMFYYNWSCQVGSGQPRAGAYLSNVSVPKFY